MRRRLCLLTMIAAGVSSLSFGGQSSSGQRPAPDDKPKAVDTTETNRPPVIPFLENTDVFWTLVKKDALDSGLVVYPNKLEANIFPHLFVYQNFTDILEIDEQANRAVQSGGKSDVKEWAMVFSGTPAVRIRMLRLRSAPVRTPSYMPRGNFQFLRVRGLKDGRKSSSTAVPGKPTNVGDFFKQMREVQNVSLYELHVIGGHHSNGHADHSGAREARRVAQ